MTNKTQYTKIKIVESVYKVFTKDGGISMNIVGARIDGRLVHGQVANLWTPKLQADRIIVVDEEAAKSDIQKSGLRMATPLTTRLSVLPA